MAEEIGTVEVVVDNVTATPVLNFNDDMTAKREGWTQDKIDQKIASYIPKPQTNGQVKTEVKEVAPSANGKTETTVETKPAEKVETKPEEKPTTVFDWSKYGVKDETELSTRLSRYTELETAHSEYEKVKPVVAEYEKVKPMIELLPQVQSPFVNDSVQALNNFIRETGIDDWSVAKQVLNAKREDLQNDPLTALAVAKILDDKGFASLGIDKLRSLEAKRLGIDSTTPYADLTTDEKDSLLYESVGALKKIDDAKNKFGTKQDIFSTLQSQRATVAEQAAKNDTAWDDLAPKVASQFKSVDFEITDEELGTIKVPLTVSEEQVQSAMKEILPVMKQFRAASDEGAKYLAASIQSRLQSVTMQQRDKEIVKAIKGILREKLVEDKVNPESPTRNERRDTSAKPKDYNQTLADERAANRF